MIVILGDLHLRSDKQYFIDICNAFLTWFDTWKYNNKDNDLILAGDLTESATPGGLTIFFLEKLINSSKFRTIHICKGNHEEKIINNTPQLVYEFFSQKKNIFIYKKATETLIGTKKVLILPYFIGLNEDNLTMTEYYSNLYKNKAFKNDYDLVVGHFSGDDIPFIGSEGVQNLDKLSGKICLGHIHTRSVSPQRYVGSVFAGKVSENDNTRAAWILDQDNWFEDKLPVFNEFLTVTYPETLPSSEALIPIYTVLNCSSEKIAREKYGNIAIRKTIIGETEESKKSSSFEREVKSVKDMNIQEMFQRFAQSQKPPLTRSILANSIQLLKKTS